MYRYESCQGQDTFLYIRDDSLALETIFNAKEVLRAGELVLQNQLRMRELDNFKIEKLLTV